MNAVNPVPSPVSGAEPSMEEILASIRRIIADDQPLPGAAFRQSQAEVSGETAETAPALAHGNAVEAMLDAMPPGQGVVASPQFPTPEGPFSVMDTPHPLAPAAEEPAAAPEAVGLSIAANAMARPRHDVHEDALRLMHEEPDAREAAVTAAHDHIYEGQFSEEVLDETPIKDAPAPPAPESSVHQPVAEEPSMHETGTREVPPQEQPGAGLFSAATSQSLAAAFNTLAISRLADDSEELRGLARDMLRPLLKDWLDAHLPGLVESIIREEIDRMTRRTR